MAVSPEDPFRDMVPPLRFREVDERVEHDGWVYYVRAVRFRHELARPRVSDVSGGLADLVFDILLELAKRFWFRTRPWQVGIIRRGAIQTWNDEKVRIVHHEKLPRRTDPAPRIAELCDEIRAGKYHPVAN